MITKENACLHSNYREVPCLYQVSSVFALKSFSPQLETIVQVHCPSVYSVFILGGRKLVSHLFLLFICSWPG